MPNKKILQLAITLIAFYIFSPAKAQTYSIQSLNGKKVDISLSYKSFNKRLTISCLQDTLYLNEYTGTKKVSILADKFLQITYGLRAGTGLELQNTAIISVANNKIKVSLLIQSYVNGLSPVPGNTTAIGEEWLYELKINVNERENHIHKLAVDIHQQQKSTLHPRINYNTRKQVFLTFDSKQYIFYSDYEYIDKSFAIFDNQNHNISSRHIKEASPVITLGEEKYYYLKDEWYKADYQGRLYKEYYR